MMLDEPVDEPVATSFTARLAARVRVLRAERGLSLEALAARSGVSRSAISLVERGASSPTAVVLDRLASGLGVPLAALFDDPAAPSDPHPLARAADQPVWRDPHSGYVRRAVSPSAAGSPLRIVDVTFPPGASVAFETGAGAGGSDRRRVHQQVWVLEGSIVVTVGAAAHRLGTGDCLAFTLDEPVGFANPGLRPARYAVVLTEQVIS